MSRKGNNKRILHTRSKGAAILRANSPELAAERKERKRSFALKIIVVIVALIEAVLLTVISTFSWIENSSSLIIRGEKLEITGGRYFQMKIDGNDRGTVDLHKYFDDVAFYQFAKASSPDGKKMYFPKYTTTDRDDGDDVLKGSYRLGDTTDINTAYYCFDIDIYNTTGKSFNYYLKQTEKLFTVTGPNSTANEAAEKCYRFSIQQGSSGNALIFGNYISGYQYTNAGTGAKPMRFRKTPVANAETVDSTASTQAEPRVFIPEDYSFSDTPSVLSKHYTVCAANSNAHTALTFRIWFEFNDPAYKALTAAQKEALNSTVVSIDIELKNNASDVRSFYLHDYSDLSATSAKLGGSDARSMYFVYSNGSNVTQYINMVPVEDGNTEGYTAWRTADDNDRPSDLIDADMRENLKSSSYYGNSYFAFGTLSNGSFTGNVKKWNLNSAPVASDNADGSIIYTVYGYTGNDNYDDDGCYGMWRTASVQPRLICFDDKMVSCEAGSYNTTGFEPIESTGSVSNPPNPVFMSATSDVGESAAATTVKMVYDAEVGVFKGYLPSTVVSSGFRFFYTGASYGTTYLVSFVSVQNSVPAEDPVYTALGYSGTGSLSIQSEAVGVGTWGDITRIDLSTKLIDHLSSNAHRYMLTYDSSVEYYMAGNEEDSTISFAYVPSAKTNIGFKRYASDSASSASAVWAASERGDSTTFYPVDCEESALGYWNVAVLVDGTRDNLIKTILDENDDAVLQFTYTDLDAPPTPSASNTMIEIDNYRWCVPNLDPSKDTVYYWFTAYNTDNNKGTIKAIFKLEHNLKNGIYYTVTEAAHNPASVLQP